MSTFHKLDTGEWVVYGPKTEVSPGSVVSVAKRGGKVCVKKIEAVGPAPDGRHVYGFFAEHCKRASREAYERRNGIAR